jgi:ABC-type sulfate transport system substrate-binding protein
MKIILTDIDLCEVIDCLRGVCRKPVPVPHVRIGFPDGSNISFFSKEWNMQVPDSGGPFTASITGFVDSKGNPVTDVDVPVWAVDNADVATVVVDPSNAQAATVTLTGALGQAQVTATFGDTSAGGFVVTGALEVIAGPAVSATMSFAGPGI